MPTKVTITVVPLYSVLQWRIFSKVSGVEMHARVSRGRRRCPVLKVQGCPIAECINLIWVA